MGQIENLTITRKKRITIANLYYSDQNEQTNCICFSYSRFDVKCNVSCDCYLILGHWTSSTKTLTKGYRIYCKGKLFTRNAFCKYNLVIPMSKKRLICKNNSPRFSETLFPKSIPRDASYIFIAKVFFSLKVFSFEIMKKTFLKKFPNVVIWNLIRFLYLCTFINPILYGYLGFVLPWGGEIKNYPIMKSGRIKPNLKI